MRYFCSRNLAGIVATGLFLVGTALHAAPHDFWQPESAWLMPTGATGNAVVHNANWLSTGPSNTLYVIDHSGKFLYRYTEEGAFVGRASDALFDDITGFDTAPNGDLYALTDGTGGRDVLVYSPELVQVDRLVLTNFVGTTPKYLSFNSQGEFYVADDITVRAFSPAGVELRSWPALSTIGILAIGPDDEVFVYENSGCSIYDRLGNFVRRFPIFGGITYMKVGQDGTVYLGYSSHRIYTYDSLGEWVGFFDMHSIPGGEIDMHSTSTFLPMPGGRVLIVGRESQDWLASWLMTWRRSGYVFQPPTPQSVPEPRVKSISQRTGAPIIDVDYEVFDGDDATVHTEVYALRDDVVDLGNYLDINSLIEGTDANVGPGTPTGQILRVTWDVGADISSNIVDLAVRVAVRDSGEMLGFDFITIPSNGVDPELTINRVPIFNTDLLPLWFWLLATDDADVVHTGNEVRGTAAAGGAYNNVVLAQGIVTTPDGADYLFDRMGVRNATAGEITRAKEGSTPGTVNQFTPRAQIELYPRQSINNERPELINEYGFDTANWTSLVGTHWFVVKKP